MKILKSIFLLALAISIVACNNDDDDNNVCEQADWVGTYSGTSDCDGTVEDATIVITASGTDSIIIEYAIPGLTSTYDPIAVTGCDLAETASQSGLTLSVEATLDGDELTFEEVLSANGVDATCTVTVTRD